MPVATANDGAEIHFEIFGHGEECWIFLHGWGGAANIWQEFLTQHFDLQNRRALAMSFRGHGKSSASQTGYSYERFAADVLAVADAAGAKQFSLVGFSFGGKVAAWLAAQHSARLTQLVLIAPVAPGLVPFERVAVQQLCDAAADLNVLDGFFHGWFSPAISCAARAAVVETMAATPALVLMATAEMLAWTSIAGSIGMMQTPLLVLAGNQDPVYGPEYQLKETMPYFPQARFTVMTSSHFIPLEQPVELAKQLNQQAVDQLKTPQTWTATGLCWRLCWFLVGVFQEVRHVSVFGG